MVVHFRKTLCETRVASLLYSRRRVAVLPSPYSPSPRRVAVAVFLAVPP